MSHPVPFVVTELLSKIYYKGLPSRPTLIATTNPNPYEEPSGPEAYTVLKELRPLGDHPLAGVWLGVSEDLRRGLNGMGVDWTSLDAFRIAKVGEQRCSTAIVWIGVRSNTLNFEEGSHVAFRCRKLIDPYKVLDYHVEIRVSHLMEQVGNRFLDIVPHPHPTFTARKPYTATLGTPISPKNRPWTEGTGGFYLSAGGDDKNVYLVTARHVVLPHEEGNNEEYERVNSSQARQDIMIFGTSGFDKKLGAIDREIQERVNVIDDTKEFTGGAVDPKLERALLELRAFRHEIAAQWRTQENRVIGELVWAPPIVLSTNPGQYTLDLAVIKIDADKLNATNYRGNTINVGLKYNRREFMEKLYPNPASPTPFKFPTDRMVTLRDQVPESDLTKQPMVDATGDPYLVVFKDGAKTGLTIGRANNVSSYTRKYFAGRYQESREWPVTSTDEHPDAFSAKGDSGSCVADAFSRIGGIITGGSSNPNLPESADITYVTPISFIMKTLHNTGRFAHAHLNPTLS